MKSRRLSRRPNPTAGNQKIWTDGRCNLAKRSTDTSTARCRKPETGECGNSCSLRTHAERTVHSCHCCWQPSPGRRRCLLLFLPSSVPKKRRNAAKHEIYFSKICPFIGKLQTGVGTVSAVERAVGTDGCPDILSVVALSSTGLCLKKFANFWLPAVDPVV